MKHMTQAPTAPTMAAPDTALGVGAILTGLLPATLHTSEAPERYTVSPVFTRRPTAGEVIALDGDEARQWMNRAGYPQVELKVSDRRLEIRNTNLEELAGGLAVTVAMFLAEISVEDDDREREVADELSRLGQREQQRWSAVRTAADDIDFGRAAAGDGGSGPAGSAPLGISRVAAELLSPTIGTDEAPERYDVLADFTRPPTATETRMIEGDRPRQRLDAAGYTAVSLQLRDRRLEIRDTTLAELAAGLAPVLADLLVEIGAEAAEQDIATVLEARRRAASERERAASVVAEAAAISFSVSAVPVSAEDDAVIPAADTRPDEGRTTAATPQPPHYN